MEETVEIKDICSSAREHKALEYMSAQGCTWGRCLSDKGWDYMCFACIAKEVLSQAKEIEP